MTETEAVARTIAPYLEGGRDYDQMPATRRELKIWHRAGMCSINDATQDDAQHAARAAITTLDRHRTKRAADADPVRDTLADSDGDDGA